MESLKNIQNEFEPIEKEIITDNEINNIILNCINQAAGEITSEYDIVILQAIAGELKPHTITYDISELISVIDSYNLIYNSDNIYYVLEPYFNNILFDYNFDIWNTETQIQETIKYDQLDKKIIIDILVKIGINSNSNLEDLLNVIEYYDIYAPDILDKYTEFHNMFKNNILDVTRELTELINRIKDNYNIIETQYNTIDENITANTETILKTKLNQIINTAATKSNYNKYIIQSVWYYQEY